MSNEHRLADALREIREIWAGAECGEPVYAQEAYAIRLCKQMFQVAVEALAAHEASRAEVSDAERLARKFHETYEWLAPKFGYETCPDTREFNPSSVNGRLMIAVCKHILITRSEENIDGI